MSASGPKRTSQSHRRCPPLSGAPWRVQDSLVFLTIFLRSPEDGKGLLLSSEASIAGWKALRSGRNLAGPVWPIALWCALSIGTRPTQGRYDQRPHPPREKYKIVIGLFASMRARFQRVMGSATEYRVMPRPRRFDPTTPPPVGQRRCPKCGVPMLLTLIEPTEQADDDQRTFECWSCSYSERVVVTFR